MADQSNQPAKPRRGGSWRGRLTVVGVMLLGLIAIAVLKAFVVRVPHPPPGAVRTPTPDF